MKNEKISRQFHWLQRQNSQFRLARESVHIIKDMNLRFWIWRKRSVQLSFIEKSSNDSELSKHSRPFIKTNQIRICSYNILSDALAETDFSKDGLFPYCPDEFVSWSYREHLILDEIKGYKASIIALQELDTKLYKGKTDYNS